MWFEKIIAIHLSVTDQVSHLQRMKSDRYFVWQEDGEHTLHAGNGHAETAVTGSTDLFTKKEFDPWVEAFSKALEDAGIPWSYEFIELEEDTGFYHHTWDWEVI